MMQNRLGLNFDFAALRADFPILNTQNRGKPLVFLDSAASAQKPQQVIEQLSSFYLKDYANIHRGIYELSERATLLYEASRQTVQKFINAKDVAEVVFVRGTTEGINLIAQSFQGGQWQADDEVILSAHEHHSNIVPWLFLKEKYGVIIKVIPMHDTGELDLAAFKQLITNRTKLVAVTHVSNVLGTINPAKEICAIAHAQHVPVLLDGAQAVPHIPVDVQDLDCDFYTFSGHKLYGPTGIGVLYAKQSHMDHIIPYQGGGSMIETVSFDKVTFAPAPNKFEAGTPDIAGVMGLKTAVDYIQRIGFPAIRAHEQALLDYAEAKLQSIVGLKIYGTAKPKVGVISFTMSDIHPHDIGTVLDHEGIAVRASHHCAMPLMSRLGIPAAVRVSFGLYNNENDVDVLNQALHKVNKVLGSCR